MKILITGANGFLGGHLLRHLKNQGFDAQGWGNEDENNTVDITDYVSVKQAFERIRPDLIVHLAALAFVLQKQPVEFYHVNVLGAENILNASIEVGVAKQGLVLASTAGVYGNQPTEFLSETSPALPVNHYSISKLSMEMIARKYQFDRPITIIRPFNMIGPSQSEMFVVPKIIKHYAERADLLEIGNTSSVRDYLYVDDFNYLMESLIKKANVGHNVVNLCTGVGHSVQDILNMMAEISGYELPIKQVVQHVRKDDIHRMVGCTAHMRQLLDARRDFVSLRESLQRIYSDKLAQLSTRD